MIELDQENRRGGAGCRDRDRRGADCLRRDRPAGSRARLGRRSGRLPGRHGSGRGR
nr:MAG TPA: hypothetical protein [Caudoviricetes sp.]